MQSPPAMTRCCSSMRASRAGPRFRPSPLALRPDIPVNGLTFADGAALYAATQAGAVIGQVFASVEVDLERKTVNVLADSPKGKNDNETIIVGAHLDSVTRRTGH